MILSDIHCLFYLLIYTHLLFYFPIGLIAISPYSLLLDTPKKKFFFSHKTPDRLLSSLSTPTLNFIFLISCSFKAPVICNTTNTLNTLESFIITYFVTPLIRSWYHDVRTCRLENKYFGFFSLGSQLNNPTTFRIQSTIP